MYLLLLLFVVGSWANDEDFHLGDLPMQNPDLFEGDILGIETIEDRNAIAHKQLRWPEGIIYYKIDPALRIHKAWLSQIMRNFEKNTCLKFVERTTEPDYVNLFKGQGCYSHVGKTGGEQPLSLGEGCYWPGTMAHEMLHAIGFLHEQNRSDRDDYINIHWENIKEGMEDQFTKFNPDQNILYNEFEYESIMLYGEMTFSKDRKTKKTMTAKKEGVRLREVSVKHFPTKSDYYRVNMMYNCVDKLGK